jgi:DNA polymerase III subunit gamma/tau
LAVREIDGASHNSVDNVRELIDSFRSLPPPGYKYKIYIIDEVHMLSIAAFNALLKSLEEPPANTIFILATTDAHKIPETVISRCQRHDFRALDVAAIETKLKSIIKKEKITADDAVLRMIARVSDGSMRDAESLLERVRSYASREDSLSVDEAADVLGLVGKPLLFAISRAILERDSREALKLSREAFSRGLDTSLFLSEFVGHFRELLIAAFAGKKGLEDMNVLPDDVNELCRQVSGLSRTDVQDLVTIARQGADSAIRSAHPSFAFEALIVRLATREPVKDLRQIVSQFGREVVKHQLGKDLPARPFSSQKSVTASIADTIEAKQLENHDYFMQAENKSYDWHKFLSQALKSSGGILGAQLERLQPTKLAKGELVAIVADEFSYKYFLKETNLEKLKGLLAEFFSVKDWHIQISVGKVGSVALSSKTASNQNAATKEELEQDVSSHPSIKSLKKAFPGAKIEKVLSTSKGPKKPS